MLNLLLSITQYLIPVLLLAIPVLLFFDISPKRRKKTAPAAIPLEQPSPEPDIRELEKKLNRLLENNSSAARIDNLQKELQTWYCADGSTSNTLPDSWSVAADQDETGNGYAESDLLFTAPVEVKFGSTANLIFYHQTARIIVNIKKTEGIDSADQIQSVKIGDNNLALSGTYTAPSGTGVTTGTWLPGPMDKTITPFKLSQPTDPSKYIASYTALVIPQNMDGKRLIAIDTELGTHYYTPKEGAAELEAGKVHTYNITIDSKEVTIEIPGSIDWGEGESGSGSIEL